MSVDIVDDLHAAEEYAESMRLKARRVIETHDALRTTQTVQWPSAQREYEDALKMLDLGSDDRFERPGCEEVECDGRSECIQGEDCGGYHPWVLE